MAKQLKLELVYQDTETIKITKEILPPIFGGGIRFYAQMGGGWYTAYGASAEAARKAVIKQYQKEVQRWP